MNNLHGRYTGGWGEGNKIPVVIITKLPFKALGEKRILKQVIKTIDGVLGKVCPLCKQFKGLALYHKNKSCRNGYKPRCVKCIKIHVGSKTPSIILCQWCNEEKPKEAFGCARKKGKYCLECRPHALKEIERRWRATSPAYKVMHKCAKYRRRAKLKSGRFTAAEWRHLLEFWGNRCLACGVEGAMTVDHVIPLSKGGTNEISNIQPLCHMCNAVKNGSIIDYRVFRAA